MRDKEVQELDRGNEPMEVQPIALPRPGFGQLFKKHGSLDGKMFHAQNKVTYTFVANEEVISLHFDKTRKTIFYKGHNIANLELTESQVAHLEQFKSELAKNDDMTHFARPYADALKNSLAGLKKAD